METTQKSVDDALRNLWMVPQEIISLGNEIAVTNKHLIQNEIDKILDCFDDIKYSAVETQTDILPCLQINEANLYDILNGILLDMTECVNHYINEAVANVRNSVTAVNTIADEVLIIQKQLISCGKDDEECLNYVIGWIYEATFDIPHRIADEVRHSVSALEEFKIVTAECGTGKIEEVFLHGGTIIGEIMRCVDRIFER
ncbi:hypothetical protein BDFB_005027 [Asbolus verrucosus]|uniref:Uncharacterized protein n=1 Tax=Asbolus verrucosus TaxID=1661398 RepID=A0A482W784_ASBVE|nr:hypothetical protein BDFB_005027 [Asbolus verrucosus]